MKVVWNILVYCFCICLCLLLKASDFNDAAEITSEQLSLALEFLFLPSTNKSRQLEGLEGIHHFPQILK